VIVNQRWGFIAVVAAVVGIGIGILIAVLAGLGTGSRLVIGVGVGLLIGGALLALFDQLIVRRILDKPTRAVVYEKLPEPVVENGMTITHRAVPAFDPETGEPLLRGASSAFFGLSLEVWSLFLVGFGILVVGVGVVMYLAR
jgi:hypothetical protein